MGSEIAWLGSVNYFSLLVMIQVQLRLVLLENPLHRRQFFLLPLNRRLR